MDPFIAIVRGDVVEVKDMLLSLSRAQVNKVRSFSGFSMLHRAAQLGNTDVCELLIMHGAEVNARSTRGWLTPLHLALGNGYIETAMLLLDKHAKPWLKNKFKEDAFTYGAKRGYITACTDLKDRVVKSELTKKLGYIVG